MKSKNVFLFSQKIYIPFKYFFDFLFAFVFIIILLPFFFLISIAVLADTKAFPIFRQKRIGKDNREFLILKFRSMNKSTPKDVPTHMLENPKDYISKFGRFIRKSSIDELPQLFNILIGQMSFIGPRPALWNQLELINERKNNHVDLLRPGLSGWAQCNGRDDIDLKQKIALDTEYLHKFSIWFDIKIFFLSIERAIVGKDVIEGKQS